MSSKEVLIEGIQEIFTENKVQVPANSILEEIIEFINTHREMEAEMSMYQTGWTPGQPCEKEQKIEKLEKELEEEKRKVKCQECNGTGRFVISGPAHRSTYDCDNCGGAGRI